MEKSSTEQKTYRYPWARALMIVVLYGALLVFLWHFPTPGGRTFFQSLFKGFLYVIAGLALVAVTVFSFCFSPYTGELKTAWFYGVGTISPASLAARSLMVPLFNPLRLNRGVGRRCMHSGEYQLDCDISRCLHGCYFAVTETTKKKPSTSSMRSVPV